MGEYANGNTAEPLSALEESLSINIGNLLKERDIEAIASVLLEDTFRDTDIMRRDSLDRFLDYAAFKAKTGIAYIPSLAYPSMRIIDTELEKKIIELLGKMNALARVIERRRRKVGMLHLDLPAVELIFDAGIMDLFVVRVAGNVCDTDEIGSIEYGLAHVKTPVLVVLGHTRCGAVTAVSQAMGGHGHKLERNIPPLVDNIIPAVKRAMEQHQDLHGDAIVPFAIEENVWQAVEDLFMNSPAVRDLHRSGKVLVTGAIYDLSTGKVSWLPQAKVGEILQLAEASPDRETEAFAH